MIFWVNSEIKPLHMMMMDVNSWGQKCDFLSSYVGSRDVSLHDRYGLQDFQIPLAIALLSFDR